MKLVALLIAATASTALAACPNKCSGHGACGSADLCSCETRWTGADCSLRECPFGLSWTVEGTGIVPGGRGMGGMHPYTECSSKGVCDNSTGECQCFDGYEGRGCRRQACPNDCSGNGRCILANAAPGSSSYTASAGAKFSSQMWDAKGARVCECDRGYEGYDCSSRVCPKGDDPVTDCSTGGATDANSLAHNMVQRLYVATADTTGTASAACAASTLITYADGTTVTRKKIDGAGGACDPSTVNDAGNVVTAASAHGAGVVGDGAPNYFGYISLQYTDMFGGEYFTRPILIDVSAHASYAAAQLDREVQWAFTNGIKYTALDTKPTFGGTSNILGGEGGPLSGVGTCTGTATGGETCDLDGGTDDTAACPAGCVYTGKVTGGDQMKKNHLKRYTADRIRDALQNLPNFAIPQVNVTNFNDGSAIWGNAFDITFGDHATAGKQNLLQCVYDTGRACDGAQPKMANQNPYGAATIAGGLEARARLAVVDDAVQGESTFIHACEVFEVPLAAGRDYEENSECSNRGLCDGSTGICSCFEGHTGENCAEQTVFF